MVLRCLIRLVLSVSNGLLTYADRIVIPAALSADILDKIHAGHHGITKCQEQARVSVWWPGIQRDIKHVIDLRSAAAAASISCSERKIMIENNFSAVLLVLILLVSFVQQGSTGRSGIWVDTTDWT
ncbi:hypothetical protein LSAT2_021983 [Lamellibrachia satsuma]|nr:hypothetical protein LSAT2_005543 [Lamellibrachia satsuma]KAI0227536.1 hypothetical protein LSAT2_021983 [Lamellibrachia satsuma]